MLPQIILDKIMAKYGKDAIYSADCEPLGREIGLSETTLKRMFGLVGENSPERRRTPHNSTMDILAKYLGYENYRELLQEIDDGNFSSDFTSMQTIAVENLDEGTQVQLRYEPSRVIVMTYLGDGEFVINESKNSKLLKGDRVRMTHLVLGQELIITEVVREGRALGGYIGAKGGGLTALEIIA